MSSESAATEVKKTSTKTGDSETTKRRIAPQRLKGWLEQAAGAYGISPSTKNLVLNGLPKYSIKKKNEDGSMVMVAKPVQVIATGTVLEQSDDRLLIRMEDDVVGVFQEVAGEFTAQIALDMELDGRSENQVFYGENLLRLKPKHFKGRYTHKFVKGEREATNKFEDMTGKRIDVIVRFYGLYKADEVYGPLVSVSAYNVLE